MEFGRTTAVPMIFEDGPRTDLNWNLSRKVFKSPARQSSPLEQGPQYFYWDSDTASFLAAGEILPACFFGFCGRGPLQILNIGMRGLMRALPTVEWWMRNCPDTTFIWRWELRVESLCDSLWLP